MNLISHVSSSKIDIDICIVKKKFDCSGSTFSQCAFKHNKLESMFRKKQVPHMHADPTRHTSHAHHTHTQTTLMYYKVYTCTHYGGRGHLAKFYFDRLNSLNFANKYVQILNVTNPCGPKKIWVPKFTLLVFYVGVGSHKT